MPKMALRFKCTASVITLLSALVNVADCGLGHTTCFKASTSDSEPNPYQHILQFNRGQFQRIQWLTAPNLNQDYSVLTASEIGKEIKCNDAYYTLRYLYMTNPRNFSDRNQVFAIHKAINEQYSGWTMKMLATSFNVAQNDIEMDVPWLMYLYINWIEERTANYVGSEMRTFIQLAHDGMIKAVETAMQDNDCVMFFPEVEGVPVSERKFSEYKVGMDNWRPTNDNKVNADAVSAVLGEHYTDLDENSGLYCFQEFLDTLPAGPVPGVRPVTQESLTANSLYLNGVFANERHSKGFTLTTQFEVLVHGKDFNDYLTERIEKVKNGSTLSFREYIINLSWIHMHVLIILDMMLLRIFYNFLEELTLLDDKQWKIQIAKFFIPYSEWCVFLHLPKNNQFYLLLKEKNEKNYDYRRYFKAGKFGIKQLQRLVMDMMMKTRHLPLVGTQNHEVQSLMKKKLNGNWLVDTAREYNIMFDATLISPLEYPTNKAILCLKVLTGFLKQILPNIHLKAVKSLAKLKSSKLLTHLPW